MMRSLSKIARASPLCITSTVIAGNLTPSNEKLVHRSSLMLTLYCLISGGSSSSWHNAASYSIRGCVPSVDHHSDDDLFLHQNQEFLDYDPYPQSLVWETLVLFALVLLVCD